MRCCGRPDAVAAKELITRSIALMMCPWMAACASLILLRVLIECAAALWWFVMRSHGRVHTHLPTRSTRPVLRLRAGAASRLPPRPLPAEAWRRLESPGESTFPPSLFVTWCDAEQGLSPAHASSRHVAVQCRCNQAARRHAKTSHISFFPPPLCSLMQAAFASFQAQIPGLLGSDGLLPIRNVLMAHEQRIGYNVPFLTK